MSEILRVNLPNAIVLEPTKGHTYLNALEFVGVKLTSIVRLAYSCYSSLRSSNITLEVVDRYIRTNNPLSGINSSIDKLRTPWVMGELDRFNITQLPEYQFYNDLFEFTNSFVVGLIHHLKELRIPTSLGYISECQLIGNGINIYVSQ